MSKTALNWGERTYIMGILNVTPDSFSGDGLARHGDVVGAALQQARAFVAAGADILDIGGESTRPGSSPVTPAKEIARVIPVIEAIRAELDVWISIDTYRAVVAKAAIHAGAAMINDIWGFRLDRQIAKVAAESGAYVVLMHNRSQPKEFAGDGILGGRYVGSDYDDLIADIKHELMLSVKIALAAGVQKEKIILDPGIGFGKTVEQNRRLVNELDQFKKLGFPILLGASRKSFIGYTLELPPDERLEGTAAAVTLGIARGADIVRVHDVKEMARVARMTDSMVR